MSDRAENNQHREHVLCPVRGAKRSLETVERAIELALAENAWLTFLFVVDVEFLGYATVARVKVMQDELREMGQFALTFVSDRARERGVRGVDQVFREGPIEPAIIDVASEIGATRLVLGRPLRVPGAAGFSKREFDSMVETIEQETNATVERVE